MMNTKNLIKILIIFIIVIVQGIIGFQYSDSLLSFIPSIILFKDNINNIDDNSNNDNLNNDNLQLNTISDNLTNNLSEPHNFSDNLSVLLEFNKDERKKASSYEDLNFEYKENREYLENQIKLLLSKLDNDKEYQVRVLVDTQEYGILSVGKQWLINKNTDYKGLIERLYYDIENFRDEQYDIYEGDIVYLKYRAFDKRFNLVDIYSNKVSKIKTLNIDSKILKENKINKNYISNKYLPFNINESAYGKILKSEGNSKFYLYNGYLIKRTPINSGFEIEILTKDGFLLGKVFDKPYDQGFIRNKNNLKIYFNHNNEIIKSELIIKTPFISKKEGDWKLKENIITFDIETYRDSKGHNIPYACGWYDGKTSCIHYLSNFNSPEAMILTNINELFKYKYNGYNIYVHNLSGFDVSFLLNTLRKKFEVKTPIVKKNKILQLEVRSVLGKSRKITLKFKDSLLILPRELRELCEKFEIPTKKGVFPYKFASLEKLNYIGNIPDYKFYEKEDITFSDWNSLEKNNWDFEKETKIYLEKDLISLYDILIKFNKIIFQKLSINMTKHISLPSLSFSDFRINHLKDEKIPILTGKLYTDIQQSYYGGIVDVYRPTIGKGYSYDVNSLYPYVMKNFDMPVGNPVFTTEKNLDKIFGFAYVTIKTTKDLKIPVLPYKTKDDRLITPNGTWSGMYFSEELKQARDKFGYEIKVHWAYQFERSKDLFKSFVDFYYKIKSGDEPSVLQFIAKLILNSLYGRFGMQEFKDAMEIVSKAEQEQIAKTHKILAEYELENETSFLRYETLPDRELCVASGSDYTKLLMEFSKQNKKLNISVGISSAITAYARMYMNEFKHLSGNECFNSDTDNIVVSKPLPEYIIGPELGKFKLEHEFNKGLFLAPKLYYLEKENGKPIVKSKGVRTDLTKEQFESLYNMEKLVIKEERWIKDYTVGTVKIVDRKINLELKVLKRNRIISQGKWIDTSPLIINDKVESLSLYGIGTIINLDDNLKLIYKNNDLKQIMAPDYKLLAAPKDIEYLNILQKNEKEISELLNKLDELNKKIENLKIKINNQSDNLWINLYKTYLIEPERLKGEILRKLYLLGVKDIDTINNFKNMIKLNTNKNIEIPNIIYLPAPSSPPVIIYIYSPIKLLALPSPNYKLIEAPNYKLLSAPNPEIIIDSNNGGGSNKIELPKIIYLSSPLIKASKKFNCNNAEIKKVLKNEFNSLNNTINNLFNELKAEKDFNTKDLLHAEYMKELYLYKIFVIKNWDLIQIPKNIIHFSQINKFGWESELKLTNKLIHMYKNGGYNKDITNIFISEMIEYSELLYIVKNDNKIDSIENISLIKNINSPIKREFSTNISKEQRIQEIIDSIKDTENFKIAMTHKSYCNEKNKLKSYETLEFYGDEVIHHHITKFLSYSYPDFSQGELTNLRSSIECGENLANYSKKIGLNEYLKMEKNFENQFKNQFTDKQKIKIFADIFESFVEALNREKGDQLVFEFLSLTILDRPKFKEKLKTYKDHFKIDEKK